MTTPRPTDAELQAAWDAHEAVGPETPEQTAARIAEAFSEPDYDLCEAGETTDVRTK